MNSTQSNPTILSLDNISAVLREQYLYDINISPELLYDTMVDEIGKLQGVDVVCTRADMKPKYLRHATIDKIVNGKYLKYCYYDKIVCIVNKFH